MTGENRDSASGIEQTHDRVQNSLVFKRAQDVGIAYPSPRKRALTSIDNRNGGHSEVLSASSAEITAVALVVVNRRLRQHRVVLDLRLPERRAVVRHQNQLRYTR